MTASTACSVTKLLFSNLMADEFSSIAINCKSFVEVVKSACMKGEANQHKCQLVMVVCYIFAKNVPAEDEPV